MGIDSRIKKLAQNEVDATILAAAGLNRIKAFNNEYCHIIEPELMLPAVGQGVIGIEIRDGDSLAQDICDAINHKPTWQLIQVEREFLKYLNADCKTPVAAYATWQGDDIKTDFMMADNYGQNMDLYSEICSVENAAVCGRKVAELMLAKQVKHHL